MNRMKHNSLKRYFVYKEKGTTLLKLVRRGDIKKQVKDLPGELIKIVQAKSIKLARLKTLNADDDDYLGAAKEYVGYMTSRGFIAIKMVDENFKVEELRGDPVWVSPRFLALNNSIAYDTALRAYKKYVGDYTLRLNSKKERDGVL